VKRPSAAAWGLALFDEQQRQIVPNAAAVSFLPIDASELAFHFSARYRAISEHLRARPYSVRRLVTLIYP